MKTKQQISQQSSLKKGNHLTETLGSSSAVDLYLGDIDRLSPLVKSFAMLAL